MKRVSFWGDEILWVVIVAQSSKCAKNIELYISKWLKWYYVNLVKKFHSLVLFRIIRTFKIFYKILISISPFFHKWKRLFAKE
jgi:hypothetical protein